MKRDHWALTCQCVFNQTLTEKRIPAFDPLLRVTDFLFLTVFLHIWCSSVSTEELTQKNGIFSTFKNSRPTICTFSFSRLWFFFFFFNQTFNNHSPCSRSYSSRQHFHGLIYPTAVLVHVAALSWTVLPALTSLCRGLPDAVLWWGSASECRLNTADLQPVRTELACFKDDLPKSFVKFRKLYH